jgi:hypothetical protein
MKEFFVVPHNLITWKQRISFFPSICIPWWKVNEKVTEATGVLESAICHSVKEGKALKNFSCSLHLHLENLAREGTVSEVDK